MMPHNRTLVYDVEADGLLDTISKLHCLSALDVDTEELFFFGPQQLEEGLKFIEEAKVLIAHNGLDYDARAIEKLYPSWKRPHHWDTLIFCKMIWPGDVLIGPDMQRIRSGKLPGQMLKRQSIEAWGYRLGEMKVGADITDWSTYTDYMGERNKSDVRVNLKLWRLITKRIGWVEPEKADYIWPEAPFYLEHEVHNLLLKQSAHGFSFDNGAAVKLQADLQNQKMVHAEKMVEVFGSWWATTGDRNTGIRPARDMNQKMGWMPDITVPRFSVKTGKRLKDYVGPPLMEFSRDGPYVPIERTTFNPSSRLHLGQRLMACYGWTPAEWGGAKKDQPVVDEGTIKAIPEDVLPGDIKQHIIDYFIITKTLGQLAEGRQAWLAKYNPQTGCIHGQMDALGTITSRATHKNPNLGQIPSVSVKETKDADGRVISKSHIEGVRGGFGWEARSLFIFKTGHGTGTDAAGLEFRGLGHHLSVYDDGALTSRVSDPNIDIHTEHSKLTGLDRAATKTTSYAYVYGAGPWKIGVGVGYGPQERQELLTDGGLRGYLSFLKRVQKDKYIEPSDHDKCCIAKGGIVIKKFEAGITGIKDLKKAIADEATANAGLKGFPWLKGLDGRKIFLRKPHAGLNTRLQSDGAIICKVWMVRFHELMQMRGYIWGKDYAQVAWVHDELQIEHKAGLEPVVAELSAEAMTYAEKTLGYTCPLATSATSGKSWAETH